MIAQTKSFSRFIGCDVGKASVVVFDSLTGLISTIVNRPKDLASFAASLDAGCLVICEATGGYEAALLGATIAAGVPAHRADARKVKAFIRSFGTLGKSDAIDARALARYGAERQTILPQWQAPEPGRKELQAMVLTRADLMAERVAYGNRLAAPGAAIVRGCITKLLACLNAQIKALDAAIAALIRAHHPLALAAKALRTIKGIGPQTTAALVALMPELGTLDRKQAAALAGLAPHPKQSGGHDGYRRVKGGRPEVKRVLFMAAMVAVRYNETFRDFYDRLVASGKKKLVAMVAVMRKMIVIANARLRDAIAAA
jgi:transposase